MNLRTGITLLLSLLFMGSAMAIPAKPGLRKIKQPDGTEITVKLCGDECLNWFETEDGYKLLRNSNNYLVYAVNDSNGDLVPSSLIYGRTTNDIVKRAAMNIKKESNFSPAQLKAAMQRMPKVNEAIFPKEGKCNLLLLMVNFSDTKTTLTKEEVENMMNQEGYNGIGSFRDFILEASNNKLDVTTTVTDWIQISKKHDYFYYDSYTNKTGELIMEALQIADSSIDFSKFDNNKDGYVDGIMVLHQGLGQESSNDKFDIWSHSYLLQYFNIVETKRKFDGVIVNAYTIEPEQILKSDLTEKINTTIGVFCHEFTHNLGAPDYYDSNGTDGGGYFTGTGNWDLMASGSWNGQYGNRPAMINAFQRIKFGWIDEPTELTSDTEISEFINTTESQKTYKIGTKENYDYFLLENRQQSKSNFDQALPGSGLIIYHVNTNYFAQQEYYNLINSTSKQSVYIVSANASSEPNNTPNSYGSINSNDAIFGNNNTGFNKYTTPGPYSWKDEMANGELYNIKNNSDGTISFSFYKDKVFDINSISGKGNRGKYTILIDGPKADGSTFRQYNIYLNDKKTGASIKDGNSLELNIEQLKGNYKYSFELVYDNGDNSEKKDFNLFIPEECLLNVEVRENGKSNTINWTVDETKMNSQDSKFVEFRIYRNDELIGNTTSNTFTDNAPLENATYTVVSAWENDVELPGLTTDNVTDIKSACTISNNIYTYYDKSSSSVICCILTEKDNSKVKVELFNTLGQCIATEKADLTEGYNTISINARKTETLNGVYVVVLTLENNEATERFSKKVIIK